MTNGAKQKPRFLLCDSINRREAFYRKCPQFEAGDAFDDDGDLHYWVELALKLIKGHVINVHYRLDGKAFATIIVNGVQQGMTVTASVAGPVNLGGQFDYKGLNVRESFRTAEGDQDFSLLDSPFGVGLRLPSITMSCQHFEDN